MDKIYESLLDSHSVHLLTIDPGRHEDAIKVDLRVVSLESKPDYEALSYVWGKEPPNESITVQGQALPTRPNLAAALRRLRRPERQRVLWVDAICMDQRDVDERAQQVGLMRRVYMQTRRVISFMPDDLAACAGSTDELARRVAQVSYQYFYPGEISAPPAEV
jgi:hypothetical protein